jgi:O-antigen/teichoic acid export membrane protein
MKNRDKRKNIGKYAYLAKNTMLFTLSSFASKLLTFFLVPFYTNVLSTTDYGMADLITTSSGLLTYVVTLNIGDAVLRFAIDRKENQREILSYGLRVILKGCTILAVVLLIATYFNWIDWPRYCYGFFFFYLTVGALQTLFGNYLRAIDKIEQVAVSGIISTFVTIMCNILLLLVFQCGLIGYMFAMISGTFVSLCYECACCGDCKGLLAQNCDKNTQKAMRNYSFPLIFNGIAWWMNSCIDKYFITALCGVSINGIYAVAAKIPTILTTFSVIFSQAWNLSAIKEFDKEDTDGFFGNTYKIYNASLTILCSGLILINIPLSKFLFAKEFFLAWQYSSCLMISVVFSALSSFLGSIFAAVKNNRIFAVSTVIAACVNLILNVILIPTYGASGAALATAFSFFLIWFIRFLCASKYIAWKINLKVDIFVYMLLFLQVLLEHQAGHIYLGQILIFIIIVMFYREYFVKMVLTVIKKSYHRVKG